MAYLEELLPEFRKGAKIRLPLWEKGQYLRYDMKHKNIVNEKDEDTDIMGCHLSSDRWELYQDPEPDWQYIIDHKCSCFFWDENFNWATCGTLGKIEEGVKYRFIMFDDSGNRSPYKQCRPIRRDEVTFYEDKKDE